MRRISTFGNAAIVCQVHAFGQGGSSYIFPSPSDAAPRRRPTRNAGSVRIACNHTLAARLSKTGPAAPHTTPGVGNCALEASLIHACVRQGQPSHVRFKAAFASLIVSASCWSIFFSFVFISFFSFFFFYF